MKRLGLGKGHVDAVNYYCCPSLWEVDWARK